MSDSAPGAELMRDLHAAERFGELLVVLLQSLVDGERETAPDRTRFFMTMFHWQMLVEQYAPARPALEEARDEQVARLLAGELFVGLDTDAGEGGDKFQRVRRYLLIVEMNDILGDARSTHALFERLDAGQPELARQYAHLALPAVVQGGDFALADRYRGDPFSWLAEVNESARTLPLFPSRGEPPRLSAYLRNLMGDVHIAIAVLRGLGRQAESDALRAALLAGLETEYLRGWALRELDEPGTLIRELVAHQMAQEDTAPD